VGYFNSLQYICSKMFYLCYYSNAAKHIMQLRSKFVSEICSAESLVSSIFKINSVAY